MRYILDYLIFAIFPFIPFIRFLLPIILNQKFLQQQQKHTQNTLKYISFHTLISLPLLYYAARISPENGTLVDSILILFSSPGILLFGKSS